MDMTIVLGLQKFSLQPTIDHHGPSMHAGYYTTSINCWKNIAATTNKFDIIVTKNSFVSIYYLMFFD